MNKFKFYFILMFSGLILFSCKDDDSVAAVPLRDFKTQFETENEMIKTYLSTHYISTLLEDPGSFNDMSVQFDPIPAGNPGNFVSLWESPKLDSIKYDLHDITYTIYYLKFRMGDPTKESPSRVDRILAAYDGQYLKTTNTMTRFEYIPYPQSFMSLDNVIPGWTEVFPLFKPGTSTATQGEPTQYANFGAGAMFIPSGLAYYNSGSINFPAYTPIMFTFKLYAMERADQDGDGILSIYEDLNKDGIFTNDDTDGDGIPDYEDTDDDGDGIATRTEIKKPEAYLVNTHPSYSGPALYYPYDPIINTEKPELSETWGAPKCNASQSADYTDPARLRKYLDPTCQ